MNIEKLLDIKNNNGTYEATMKITDPDEKYTQALLRFQLLDNSSLEDISLNNIRILSFEIK